MKQRWLWCALAVALAAPALAQKGSVTAKLAWEPFATVSEALKCSGPSVYYGYQTADLNSGFRSIETETRPASVRFRLLLGAPPTLVPAELSKPESGGSYSRLAIDWNGDGTFSEKETYTGRLSEGRWCFGPITSADGKGAKTPFYMVLLGGGLYHLTPAGMRAGRIILDGKPARVAVVDRDLNGLYNATERQGGRGGDNLLLDLDRNGQFEDPDSSATNILGGRERRFLPRLLCLPDGRWRAVNAAEDGSTLTVAPYAGPMGRLKLGNGPCSAVLVSKDGLLRVPLPKGQGDVPAGSYRLTEAVVGAEAGGKRTFATLYPAGVAPLVVRVTQEKTAAPAIGPPFKAVLSASRSTSDLQFSLALRDRGECRATAFAAEGGSLPAPTLEIRQGDRVVHSAQFQFG